MLTFIRAILSNISSCIVGTLFTVSLTAIVFVAGLSSSLMSLVGFNTPAVDFSKIRYAMVPE